LPEVWIEIVTKGHHTVFTSKPKEVKGEDLVIDLGGVEVLGDIKVNIYDKNRDKVEN
jgi:hypothetical protein